MSYIHIQKKTLITQLSQGFNVFYRWFNDTLRVINLSSSKGGKILDRNIQQMFRVSVEERQELMELMSKYGLSLSDVIRKAIKEAYGVEGFEPSYDLASKRELKKSRKWELY